MRLAPLLAVALLATPLAAAQTGAVLYPLPGRPAVADVTVTPMASVPETSGVRDIYGQPSTLRAGRDVVVDGRSVVGRWLALEVEGDARATRDLTDETLVKVLVVNPGGHAILRGVDRRAGAAPEAFTGDIAGGSLVFDGLPGTARLELDGRRLVLTDPLGRRTRFLRLVDAETTGYTTDALVPERSAAAPARRAPVSRRR